MSYAKLKKDINKMITILKKKETTKEPKEVKDSRIIKKTVKKKKNERNRIKEVKVLNLIIKMKKMRLKLINIII